MCSRSSHGTMMTACLAAIADDRSRIVLSVPLLLRPLRPRPQHEALQNVRRQQETEAWRVRYGKRAGIEGTLSQAVRAFGLRRCRYLGLAKTKLQHVFTAIAINVVRFDAWMTERPFARTRRSAFASLAPIAGAA